MKSKFMVIGTTKPTKLILHAGNYPEVAPALIQ